MEGVYDDIMKASRGDMRRAITMIQSASGLNSKRITSLGIHEVAGYIPDEYIRSLLSAFSKGPLFSFSSITVLCSPFLGPPFEPFRM